MSKTFDSLPLWLVLAKINSYRVIFWNSLAALKLICEILLYLEDTTISRRNFQYILIISKSTLFFQYPKATPSMELLLKNNILNFCRIKKRIFVEMHFEIGERSTDISNILVRQNFCSPENSMYNHYLPCFTLFWSTIKIVKFTLYLAIVKIPCIITFL